jgi:hypothetical protein
LREDREPTLPSQWDSLIPALERIPALGVNAAGTSTRKSRSVTVEVPTEYLTWIGRLIVQRAHVEWLLLGVVCKLLGITRKAGQAIFQSGPLRLGDTLPRLLEGKRIPLPHSFPALASLMVECEEAMHLLQTGVWSKDPTSGQVSIESPKVQKQFGTRVSSNAKTELRQSGDIGWFGELQTRMERLAAGIEDLDQYIDRTL